MWQSIGFSGAAMWATYKISQEDWIGPLFIESDRLSIC